MPKSVPIKTDTFRFITFRSPEQLTRTNKPIRFVVHPDIGRSIINSCPVPTGKEKTDAVFLKYLSTFKPIKSVAQVKELQNNLYDFSNSALKSKGTILEANNLVGKREVLLSVDQEIALFDQLIYQVITKESKHVRHAISQMLIANHALKYSKHLYGLGIVRMTDIKIEIPYQVFECFRPWSFAKCGGSLEGIQNLGIADFRRVEQEVCCYVPGEVSHIENIMAKEYKERSTRNYVRTEDTIETTRETEVENLTDVTTATRNEMSSEIANVLQNDRSNNYGGSLGVSAEYLGAQIDVNAYADFATSNSSTYSNIEAKTYAEEVTKRALERIVQKTSEKRTSKVIKEFEENNKHGFDNRNGDSHVTGVYRWVDIIYKNRLVNYGKRLMVEFMVPEPAEFYKRVLEYTPAPTNAPNEPELPEPPRALAEFGINGPNDITDLNVMNASSYFGVSIDELPTAETTITKDLSPLAPVDHNRRLNTQSLIGITVPPMYEADTIKGSYTYTYRANSWSSPQQAFCDFTFGGKIVHSGKDYSGSKKTKTVNININFSPNLSGTIPVSVGYSGTFGFYGAVSIKCVLKASVISDWQNDAYMKLLAAYNQKLDAYNQELEAIEQENEANFAGENGESTSSNPRLNRIIEQRELKRICIEMIMEPFCRQQGQQNYYDVNACDLYNIPKVKKTEEFTDYAKQVKFFEQAIDWQIMSYLFYPYYWADKCDWADLMQSESSDLVFQAFLQSGMSRVVVPIRPRFTEAFAYYLETGDIWLGNELVAGSQSDLYLSIAEEMQTIEGVVEEEWETRVPTTLAIIQGKSAFLDQEGLPCCTDVENEEQTTDIKGSDTILQIITP